MLRSRCLVLAVLGALCASALCSSTAAPARAAGESLRMPAVHQVRTSPNRTLAARTHRTIRYVVVHVTEGSFTGSVRWLRNPKAHVSAHFVIARSGRIAQLVPVQHIAWHSGNKRMNTRSVGIEHVGWTYGPSGFTAAQYRASARLTAYLLKRYRIPATRRHVIGHDEVPDPFRPWLGGGSSHHTDPGPRWSWGRYMGLVRGYLAAAEPLRIASVGLRSHRTLTGRVPWRVRVSGGVRGVAFAVDGRVLWTDRVRPFSFGGARGLPTMHLANGRHVLEVRAFRGRRLVRESVVVHVRNRAFTLTTAGARRWGRLQGMMHLRARPWGAKARRISLFIDGYRAATDTRAPFLFRWNTRLRRDGKHVLVLVAHSRDGRVTRKRIPVVVANRADR